MATHEITDKTFKSLLEENNTKLVIVDFWADWCGPCKMLAPILDSLSNKYEETITVFKLNTDTNPDTAQNYQITSIPCCILFKNNKEVHRVIGHKSEESFEAELKLHL